MNPPTTCWFLQPQLREKTAVWVQSRDTLGLTVKDTVDWQAFRIQQESYESHGRKSRAGRYSFQVETLPRLGSDLACGLNRSTLSFPSFRLAFITRFRRKSSQ